MSARVILVAAPKGGCGKTTTTQTLGLALMEAGKRVLFVDTDPQGNLSSVLGYRHKRGAPTLYTVLREFTFNRKKTLPTAIYHLPNGANLVPANMALNAANDELASQVEREHILEKLLAPVRDLCDFVLIDSLPYLGVLLNNALVAADELIIPIQAEPLGIAGGAMMLTHLQKVRDDGMISRLVVRGGLMTMVDRRTALNTQSIIYAHEVLGPHMPFFKTEIERSIRVGEAQLVKKSVLTFKPRETEKIAQAYRSVRDELLAGALGIPIQNLTIPADFVEDILEQSEEEGNDTNA